jgi:hypothetical protein
MQRWYPDLLIDTNAATIESGVTGVVEYLIRNATAKEVLYSYSIELRPPRPIVGVSPSS